MSLARSALLRRRVETTYRQKVSGDDIKASTAAVATSLVPSITEAQRSAQQLSMAFYRSLTMAETNRVIEPLPPLDVAGTTRDGVSLAAGMAAIGPMVLGQIGDGVDLATALAFGAFLFVRFADAEVTGPADREREHQEQRPEIVGWEGVVSAGACDPCSANSGHHDLGVPMYRHGNCNCERVPVFA